VYSTFCILVYNKLHYSTSVTTESWC